MADTLFVRASDVAKEMGVSEAMAYKIIRKLNNELKEQGFVTVQGRLSRQYFEERIYGIKTKYFQYLPCRPFEWLVFSEEG